MDAIKTAYELAYWKAVRAGHAERYAAILERWDLHSAGSVLEVGTGPLGGCLPHIESRRKVGLDPLYGDYEAAGLLVRHPDVEYVTSDIETLGTQEQFQAVISMNTLDHGNADFSAVDKIATLLEPGGRFFLHVHLRTPAQLNVGHDHALRMKDLLAAVERSHLQHVHVDVLGSDPIEGGAYKTVIGVWRKPWKRQVSQRWWN